MFAEIGTWPLDPQLICLPYLHHTILTVLFVPLMSIKSNFVSSAFRSSAASVWNLLPYPVRASPTLFSFKRALKTYYNVSGKK